MEKKGNEVEELPPAKSLLVMCSSHHHNTEKIANACAHVRGTEVKTSQQVTPEEIALYDLVGFGSGIYHATLTLLCSTLPTGCHKLRERTPSSSRLTVPPPFLRAGNLLPITTRRSGRSCRRKGTQSSGNSGVRVGTRTVFSGSSVVSTRAGPMPAISGMRKRLPGI